MLRVFFRAGFKRLCRVILSMLLVLTLVFGIIPGVYTEHGLLGKIDSGLMSKFKIGIGNIDKVYAESETVWFQMAGEQVGHATITQIGNKVVCDVYFKPENNWGPGKHNKVEHNTAKAKLVSSNAHQFDNGWTGLSRVPGLDEHWKWEATIPQNPQNQPSYANLTISLTAQVSEWSNSGGYWHWNGAHYETTTQSLSLRLNKIYPEETLEIRGFDADTTQTMYSENRRISGNPSSSNYVYKKDFPVTHIYLGYNTLPAGHAEQKTKIESTNTYAIFYGKGSTQYINFIYAKHKPHLSIQKTPDKSTASAGSTVRYTVTVTNSGNYDWQEIMVKDEMAIPDSNYLDLQLDPSSTIKKGDNVVITPTHKWALIKDFKRGEVAKFIFTIKIPDGTPDGSHVKNTAIAEKFGWPEKDKVKAEAQVLVMGSGGSGGSGDDIAVEKKSDKDGAAKGDTVNYTVKITNKGSKDLQDVKVEDSMTAQGVKLAQKLPKTNMTVTENADGSATIATLKKGETVEFVYSYTIPAAAAVGDKIKNTAKVTDKEGKVYKADHDVNVLKADSELTVTKVSDKLLVEAGTVVEYTLRVKNTGKNELKNVAISDDMSGVPNANFLTFVLDPGETTEDSTPANITLNAGNRSAVIKSLKVNKAAVFKYKVRIPDTAAPGEAFTNTAAAQADDGTKAIAKHAVRAKAKKQNIEISKETDKATAKPGETITYTVHVENISGEIQNDVEVEDSLPGVELEQKWPKTNITVVKTAKGVKIGKLEIGEIVVFEYTYKVPASSETGDMITNRVKATDSEKKIYIAEKNVRVRSHDKKLEVTKTSDKTALSAGEEVVYTITVRNIGTSDFSDVNVSDFMPEIPDENFLNFEFDPGTSTVTGGANVSVNSANRNVLIKTFRRGEKAVLKCKVKIPDSAEAGKVYENTAIAKASDGTEDRAKHKVIVGVKNPNINIKKEADLLAAKPGQTINYRVHVENISGKLLLNTKIKDSIPGVVPRLENEGAPGANTTVSVSPEGEVTIGKLGIGEKLTLVYSYTLPDTQKTDQIFTNRVTAKDSEGKIYVDEKDIYVKPHDGKIKVRKNAKPKVKAGEIVIYSISVKNDSGGNLEDVEVTDFMLGIPAANFVDLSYDSSSTTPGGANIVIKSRTKAVIKSFPKDTEARFVIKVKMPENSVGGTVYDNTVLAKAKDGTMASDDYSVTIVDAPTLDVEKTADKARVKQGETINYKVVVKNIDTKDLHNVKVEDHMPGIVMKQNPETNQTVSAIPGGMLIGTLKAGETVVFEYTYTVPGDALAGGTVKNKVKVSDGEGHIYEKDKNIPIDPKTPPGPGPGPGPGPSPDPDPKKPDDETLLDKMRKQQHFAYMTGYPDRTFRPGGNMSRQEVTVMLGRLLTGKMVSDVKYDSGFPDVTPDLWSNDYIGFMRNKNIIKGYEDGTFRPTNSITRAEFAAMVTRFDEVKNYKTSAFYDVPSSHWANQAISMAASRGWVTGYPDGSFKPDKSITRAEVVAVTNRMLNRVADQEYVDKHQKEIKFYKDLSKNYWAYYTIQEASNGHDYKRKADGGETWLKLWDLFIPN